MEKQPHELIILTFFGKFLEKRRCFELEKDWKDNLYKNPGFFLYTSDKTIKRPDP